MNKFKVGDEVVCINNDDASELLELGHYEILEVLGKEDCYDVQVEKGGWFYFRERFELFSEWAAHQKPVNKDTELSLTKLQVKMLQDWKKDNIKKVERYEWLRSVGKEQQNVIAHYAHEEMDKIIDKLMELETLK